MAKEKFQQELKKLMIFCEVMNIKTIAEYMQVINNNK